VTAQPVGPTPPSAADLVAMLAAGMPSGGDGDGWTCVTCARPWSTQERALSCSCGGGARLVIPGAMAAVAVVGAALADLVAREVALAEREARVDALLEHLAAHAVQVEHVSNVAVPAVTVATLGSVPVDVTITWPTPFPDDAYSVLVPAVAAAGLGAHVTAALRSQSPTGCVVRVTTTATLAAGAATVSALARRVGPPPSSA